MNKKAISPLIATVLLIVFALVVAGIVMQWGTGQVTEITTEAEGQINEELACTSILPKISISAGATTGLSIVNAHSATVSVGGTFNAIGCTAVDVTAGGSEALTCGTVTAGDYVLTVTEGSSVCGPITGTI